MTNLQSTNLSNIISDQILVSLFHSLIMMAHSITASKLHATLCPKATSLNYPFPRKAFVGI